MEKLSGLILDVYDDSEGVVLQELFPEPTDLTELEKQAHSLTAEERDALPDEAFALVLVDGDTIMKKYATVDPGNTTLSVIYFMKNAHKLPIEAQHVAAENLWSACEVHGLEAPEGLKKVALDLRRAKSKLDTALRQWPAAVDQLEGNKEASAEDTVLKEAFSPMGLLAAGLVVPEQARQAKGNLAATKGTQGVVLTPQQIQQRKTQMGMY